MLEKCSRMLVSCKNAKKGSRAFKRTDSEVFSTKSHPDIIYQSLVDFSIFNVFSSDFMNPNTVLVAKKHRNIEILLNFHC